MLGATGSGKTTGNGRAVATAFLSAGFGGLVLTAKPDERRTWEGYCRETGRLGDLVVFGPHEPARLNFLDYELTRKGEGAGLTDNIVNPFSIGRSLQMFMNGSNSYAGGDWLGGTLFPPQQPQTSASMSDHMEFEVQSAAFTTLRTGGPANGCRVDAVVFRSGSVFKSTGKT